MTKEIYSAAVANCAARSSAKKPPRRLSSSNVPLRELTPAQKVELFKIVTGSDYRAMQDFGAYIFYRLGIAPDGTWHFFVSGE